MSADKLAKELNQFERMTRAVMTVGEAVQEGMLKKQHLDGLEKGIKLRKAESEKLNDEIAKAKIDVKDVNGKAKGVLEKAQDEALNVIEQAKSDAKLIVSDAKDDAKEHKKKANDSKDIVFKLEKQKSSLERELLVQQEKIDGVKMKLRLLLD